MAEPNKNFLSFVFGSKNGNTNKTGKQPQSGGKVPKTSQSTIPYRAAYDNGIIEIEQGIFSKSYFIDDVNFKIASQNDQDDIFLKYGDMLNMFDHNEKIEVTVFNRSVVREKFEQEVLMENKYDGLDEYRQESNEILLEKMSEGKNNITKERYLTLTIEAKDYDDAVNTFVHRDAEISAAIKRINGSETSPLNLTERLSVLYDIYNPNASEPLALQKVIKGKTVSSFDVEELKKQGLTTKDAIAPTVIRFNNDNTLLGETYAQTLFLQGLPSFLSTDFMSELNDLPFNLLTTVHFNSMRQDKAMSLIKRQIVNINSNVIDKQKRASKSGYSADLISPELLRAKDEADKTLSDMTSRNQKMFYVTFVLTHFADDIEMLKEQLTQILTVSQKHMVRLAKLNMQQEVGFNASLPLGVNKLETKRLLTTETASLFIPFSAQELSQNGGIYYGLNAVSHNLILFDRTKSQNANGIILGTPGSGKSFSAKREIISVLLNTNDDVYIVDPEREYAPLAELFGGEVVRIAAGSKVYLNPMDMDLNYANDDDPVTLKADFICSLCETILGGKYGLSQSQNSIIDRCVRQIYQPYLNWLNQHPEKGSCDLKHMPTLRLLYDVLLRQPEPEAKQIALALERYATGSLDTFAHTTNVDVKKRFVVYDIKDVGSGMKEMGLQICLNDIWNRTISNKQKYNKRTWFYIDEFYLLTQTDSSAKFLQEIFKRTRKWGGVPTGITQNVEDMLVSKEARSIIANCQFVMMLNQAPTDKQELAKMFNISPAQLSYITNADTGQGLIYTGKSIVPFIDKYPTNTKTYAAMTTKLDDAALANKANDQHNVSQ